MSEKGQLRAYRARELPAGSEPAVTPPVIGSRAPKADPSVRRIREAFYLPKAVLSALYEISRLDRHRGDGEISGFKAYRPVSIDMNVRAFTRTKAGTAPNSRWAHGQRG